MDSEKENRSCDFCATIEGQPRPIGLYIVKLSLINYKGSKKLACQTCRITVRKQYQSHNKSIAKYFKKYFSRLKIGF